MNEDAKWRRAEPSVVRTRNVRRRGQFLLAATRQAGTLAPQMAGHCRDLATVAVTLVLQRAHDDDLRTTHRQLLVAARSGGDRRAVALALMGIGAVEMTRYRITSATRLLIRAMSHFDAAGDRYGHAGCLRMLGFLDLHAGEHARAERRIRRSLPVLQAHGDLSAQAFALRDLGRIALDRGPPSWPGATPSRPCSSSRPPVTGPSSRLPWPGSGCCATNPKRPPS